MQLHTRIRVEHAARRWLTIAAALAFLALAAVHTSAVRAQSGTIHTLTNADNGTTVSAAVGDTIEVRLTPVEYTWDVSVEQNPPGMLFRPPLLLVRGLQQLWNIKTPGTAKITAIGTPACAPQCLAPSLMLTFTVVAGGSPPPSGGASLTFATGWNLMALPGNTALAYDAFSWDPAAGAYQRVPAGMPLKPGRGYWAYFPVGGTVTLKPADSPPLMQDAPAGQWIMVGDPSTSQPAIVTGADAVFVYDTATDSYRQTTTLIPGQGAWAISSRGGQITVAAPTP